MSQQNTDDLSKQKLNEFKLGINSVIVFSIMDLPSLLMEMAESDCDQFEVIMLRTFPADDDAPFACIVRNINKDA